MFGPMRKIGLAAVILWGCDGGFHQPLFTDNTQSSGITFTNFLTITPELNPYTYRNFYNGAGVAIGDINNDGLLDIYLTGNQVDNKLYLNLGNLKFRDITNEAGVSCSGVWSSGVTMADVNADGWLDIYVCKSGAPGNVTNRHNELFINNGDLTFTEQAAEYGLDITGLSVQAAFFDYDRDGDLDCYVLTNSFKSIGHFDLIQDQRKIPDSENGGNKFFRNEGNHFVDVTDQAGIYHSSIGFGLGITLGDFNEDSWVDIFVSNDFFERDYLYINNGKGSFRESLVDYFESISMGSMGADYADLDGDGIHELFVTEMLPETLSRKKSKVIFEGWDKYQTVVDRGYHHQFTRNVLQKRISNSRYVEIGRLAGVAASEWSWGALLFDMDNDGHRDIFIANGIYKDLLDRDYLSYSNDPENVKRILQNEKDGILKLIDIMPSSPYPNFAFRNEGNLKFVNQAAAWGLGEPMYSSGSAYGDLDNDGDLDLVVNNIQSAARIYQNNSDTSRFKSISLTFSSSGSNRFMTGTHIKAYAGNRVWSGDNYVVRGYQSSVQPTITLGLGTNTSRIDSLVIHWPDDYYSVVKKLSVNRAYHFSYDSLTRFKRKLPRTQPEALPWKKMESFIVHQGSNLVDFNRERLLSFMYSTEMPTLLKTDINSDGQSEVYLGGGKDQQGTFLFLGDSIIRRQPEEFRAFSQSEETEGVFFDADNDGDQDFYFSTGGRFYSNVSSAQRDRLFLNSGKGTFQESNKPLPTTDFSTSKALAVDFDRDGDLDLFVTERFDPFIYGVGGRGYLLSNNGKGEFSDVTNTCAPGLVRPQMITDAVASDYDQDGWTDLIIVGDWMPVTFFRNHNGCFEADDGYHLDESTGWWNTIETADLNRDGKPDFVIGNHGKNSFFQPGIRMYVQDFDENGSVEQVFCANISGKYYPLADKDDLLSQIPTLKKSLIYYKDYQDKSIDDIWGKDVISKSSIFEANVLASSVLLSTAKGYTFTELPIEAQYSPIHAILLHDLDGDGVTDMIAGGNQYQVKPQYGRFDASQGWFFKGKLAGNSFNFLPGRSLGITGEIRDIVCVDSNGRKFIIFAKYDDELEIYKMVD